MRGRAANWAGGPPDLRGRLGRLPRRREDERISDVSTDTGRKIDAARCHSLAPHCLLLAFRVVIVQIRDGILEMTGALPEQAQSLIAKMAEQSPDFAGSVAVIYRQLFVTAPTDRAAALLPRPHLVIVLGSDAIPFALLQLVPARPVDLSRSANPAQILLRVRAIQFFPALR